MALVRRLPICGTMRVDFDKPPLPPASWDLHSSQLSSEPMCLQAGKRLSVCLRSRQISNGIDLLVRYDIPTIVSPSSCDGTGLVSHGDHVAIRLPT